MNVGKYTSCGSSCPVLAMAPPCRVHVSLLHLPNKSVFGPQVKYCMINSHTSIQDQSFKKKQLMSIHDVSYPKNPWDVGRGVKTTSFEAPRVSLGGFGVSIGMVRIVRVVKKIYPKYPDPSILPILRTCTPLRHTGSFTLVVGGSTDLRVSKLPTPHGPMSPS